MVILVTGASGFIGQNLIRYLDIQSQNQITELYGIYNSTIPDTTNRFCDRYYKIDLTNPFSVKTTLDHLKPNVIIHLAAQADPRLNSVNPSSIIDTNIKATHNLCHFAPKGTRLIFSSSITVYGDNQYSSEFHHVSPTSIYGITKVACENIISYYNKVGNIDGVSLRFCATVGNHGLTHGMIKDFTRKILSDSKELEIFGDKPGSFKPYLNIMDACHAINNLILPIKNENKIINVCPKDSLSSEEVAKIMMQKLRRVKPIKWLGSSSNIPGDNKYLSANSDWYNTFVQKIGSSRETIENYCEGII